MQILRAILFCFAIFVFCPIIGSGDFQVLAQNESIPLGLAKAEVESRLGAPFSKADQSGSGDGQHEVWTYTRTDVKKEITLEETVKDEKTGWPMLHKVAKQTSCQVIDKFLVFKKGRLAKISAPQNPQPIGGCTIDTTESFEAIPAVN